MTDTDEDYVMEKLVDEVQRIRKCLEILALERGLASTKELRKFFLECGEDREEVFEAVDRAECYTEQALQEQLNALVMSKRK